MLPVRWPSLLLRDLYCFQLEHWVGASFATTHTRRARRQSLRCVHSGGALRAETLHFANREGVAQLYLAELPYSYVRTVELRGRFSQVYKIGPVYPVPGTGTAKVRGYTGTQNCTRVPVTIQTVSI